MLVTGVEMVVKLNWISLFTKNLPPVMKFFTFCKISEIFDNCKIFHILQVWAELGKLRKFCIFQEFLNFAISSSIVRYKSRCNLN